MADAPYLVDVAIPLPVEGPFSYMVPKEMVSRVDLGRRVIVPFRNKIRAGFIVGHPSSALDPTKLKAISDIPEEPSYLTTNLWRFICWVARYYLLPKGLVLKTALPPGSKIKSRPWVILTPEGRRWFGGRGDGQGPQLPLKLLKNGYIPYKVLAETIPSHEIDEALKREWIRVEERIARPRIMLHKTHLPELLLPADSCELAGERVPSLTSDQNRAVEEIGAAIEKGGFHPFLLFGVTGSGKTEVYLRAIKETTQRGMRALVLVPEIALTPQLARRFLQRFGGGVALLHSGLTPAQRLDEWLRIREGRVNVVIGARSGIFAPLENLGLIIVDEEHDPSYKQEDSCPYHARDMALTRGSIEGACVILGSATPSFETFVNAQRGKIARIDLPERYHGGNLPAVELVDLKASKPKGHKPAFLTPLLIKAIQETLERQEQVILFLNRRGFDTFAQCRLCGYVFKCPNCDISLTHHKKIRALRCHICGIAQTAPPLCPQCSGTKLFFGGVGTQKIEEELSLLFPFANIARLDRDATRRRGDLDSILARFRAREIDILAGTQMIVKGHDFPGISLVGVLCGDLSLHFPDFRAAERTFQLLTQVAGRTGRQDIAGRVILQTFDPEHQVIRYAAAHAYEDFFRYESELRRELLYPPFGHLILLRIEGNNEQRVEQHAIRIGEAARRVKGISSNVLVMGPAPSPRRKMIGKYRWQVLLKGQERGPIREIVSQLMMEGCLSCHGLKVIVDVDPIDLL